MEESSKDVVADKKVVVPKNAAQLQKIKLEKLMKNPAKPAYVPERPEEKLPGVFRPPEFIRNIWGSSAGAGSGDFHVYRGVRRREYARQKFENIKAEKDQLDEEYHKKVVENEKLAEERTAKKRAKRLKKKMKQKAKKQKIQKKKGVTEVSEDEENSSEQEDEDKDSTSAPTKTEQEQDKDCSSVPSKNDPENGESDNSDSR